MPEPSSPELPEVTRTETTLGSTAFATATQLGAPVPPVTSGAELLAAGLPDPLPEPDEYDDVAAVLSRFSVIPRVNRLDSTAAAAPTATTPPQPGPRRPPARPDCEACCGTGGPYGGRPPPRAGGPAAG